MEANNRLLFGVRVTIRVRARFRVWVTEGVGLRSGLGLGKLTSPLRDSGTSAEPALDPFYFQRGENKLAYISSRTFRREWYKYSISDGTLPCVLST